MFAEQEPDPLYRRLREHACRRLPTDPSTDPAQLVQDYKYYLYLEGIMIERFHRKGDSGIRVAQTRSFMMDVLLENLLLYTLKCYSDKRGALACPFSIVALGGYGRRELSPHSDIDIMFLYPDKVKSPDLGKLQQTVSDKILYTLWDIGLKVGHSSRNTKDAIDEAKNNIQTKTSMLESHLIAGSVKIYETFKKEYHEFYMKDAPEAYIQERLVDQQKRRERFGNTVFLQEPDIKNGVGGLRDYQNILWMACIKLGTKSIDDLMDKKYLSKTEHREMFSAYNFLLRTRNELHFQSKYATDLLSLEKQPSIAWSLGYRQDDIIERVEAFMRDYYRNAQNIFRTASLLERRLAIVSKSKLATVVNPNRLRRKKLMDGFILRGQTLYYEDKNVFKDDPERLIRVFRHCQQFEASLDVELAALIRISLPLITKNVYLSPSANKSFRYILQTAGNVYPILSSMHDLGVLERFIPEFQDLTCLVQHEHFHRYTADIHTLDTIKHLDRVFNREGDLTKRYYQCVHETSTPTLLYLILLLHDIGKGKGIAKHDVVGAEMADPLIDRLGVSAEHKEKILFIIRNHLEMARIWQRLDIDDSRTIKSFADLVQNEEQLRYLYIHTYCDACGTSTALWNEYKDMLHRQLYQNTLAYFRSLNAETPEDTEPQEDKNVILKEDILAHNPKQSKDEIDAHFNLLPERYFLHQSLEDVSLHIDMVHQLLEKIASSQSINSLEPIIDWRDDLNLSMTVVNIVTWDRAGLFYRLAGAFSVAGLNIISSKAISRNDHITIDTFYVCEPDGGVVQNKATQETFRKYLNAALLEGKDLLNDIIRKAKKRTQRRYTSPSPQLQASIPVSIDVYHELSLKRTIVEIESDDQIGLLYRFTKAIFDHGFDITFARISTERGIAIDTFYIEKFNAVDATTDPNDLLELRETLSEIASTDMASVAS